MDYLVSSTWCAHTLARVCIYSVILLAYLHRFLDRCLCSWKYLFQVLNMCNKTIKNSLFCTFKKIINQYLFITLYFHYWILCENFNRWTFRRYRDWMKEQSIILHYSSRFIHLLPIQFIIILINCRLHVCLISMYIRIFENISRWNLK